MNTSRDSSITTSTASTTTSSSNNGNGSDIGIVSDIYSADGLLTIEGTEISSGLLLWAGVNGLLFVLILVGNALTIVAVRTCRRLRCVISNIFILSLAISDFIVGLALPYHLAFYLGFKLGQVQALCLLRFFLIICACCVSILTLISIAIDRYIAVVYALHYRRFMTRRVAYVIISANWSTGVLVALIPIFWNKWSTAEQCEFDEVLSPWYVTAVITPGFAIIWICMLTIYWRILREATAQAHKMRRSVINETHTGAPNLLNPDWKSIQIVVFIMGCFTFCWLPYFIVAIAQFFQICRSSSMIYKMAFSLAIFNSALNPIIYSWKNLNFRRAFARTLCCKAPVCCMGDDEDDNNNSERVCYTPQPYGAAATSPPPTPLPCDCDTKRSDSPLSSLESGEIVQRTEPPAVQA